jgi:hypothetical protein
VNCPKSGVDVALEILRIGHPLFLFCNTPLILPAHCDYTTPGMPSRAGKVKRG